MGVAHILQKLRRKITMEIKRKAIIKVNSKFTKGKDCLYLVLFNGGGKNLQCAKIFLGGDHFRNDIMRIPPEYVGTQHLPGYVNGFDGLVFIWQDDIVKVVSELPDAIYNSIIKGIMLVFMGMYKIENINKPDFKYLVIDKPMSVTIDSSMLFNAMIGGIGIENQNPVQVEVPKEEEIISPIEEPHEVIEDLQENSQVEPIDIPDNKDIKKRKKKITKKLTSVIKIGNKSYDDKVIQDIKQKYKDISDNDSRICYLYDLWAVNNRLNVSQAYSIIIKNKSGRSRKNAFALTKEEFIFILREPSQVILNTKLSSCDGSERVLDRVSKIQSLKTICKDLYFCNTEKSSKVISEKWLTESEKDSIRSLIDEGKSKEEILTLFEDCNVEKRRSVIGLINLYTNIAGGIIMSKRLQNIKSYHGYDNDEEMKSIVNYFENNFETVGLVASGIMPEGFMYNQNKAIMIAIYLNNPKNVSYIIMNRLGDYVRGEGLDLYSYMIGVAKNRYIHTYIKCDKAKNNKRIRQETIYGFLKRNKTKKPYTDNLNIEEQNFINLLNINKRDYLEDRDFVLANMSKFDTWSSTMRRNRKLARKEGI